MASNADVQGHQQAARLQLKTSGEEGTGSFTFSSPSGIDGDYSVVGQFQLDPQPELLDGSMFPLPVGLRLLGRPGDVLLGPLALRELPATERTPCHSGTQVETLSLSLPQGWRAVHVPTNVTMDNDLLHYESRWSAAGQTIAVRREMTSKVAGSLCQDEARREAAKALSTIRRDLGAQIQIAEPEK
jgi:hypothetical protein